MKNVSRETLGRLQIFVELLLKWQQRINLISSSTIESVWERHVEDSLQLMSYIKDVNKTLMDVGSGAGFPGVVLAAAGQKKVTLVESDKKKCAFLLEATRSMGLSIKVESQRVEKLPPQKVDIITARGVARIKKLLEDTQTHFQDHTQAIFLKGSKAQEEIFEAQTEWDFKVETYPSVTNPDGVIVILSEIKKKS